MERTKDNCRELPDMAQPRFLWSLINREQGIWIGQDGTSESGVLGYDCQTTITARSQP